MERFNQVALKIKDLQEVVSINSILIDLYSRDFCKCFKRVLRKVQPSNSKNQGFIKDSLCKFNLD